MNKDELIAFMQWLYENQTPVCGNAYDQISGTHTLLPMSPDDFSMMVDDFITEQEG